MNLLGYSLEDPSIDQKYLSPNLTTDDLEYIKKFISFQINEYLNSPNKNDYADSQDYLNRSIYNCTVVKKIEKIKDCESIYKVVVIMDSENYNLDKEYFLNIDISETHIAFLKERLQYYLFNSLEEAIINKYKNETEIKPPVIKQPDNVDLVSFLNKIDKLRDVATELYLENNKYFIDNFNLLYTQCKKKYFIDKFCNHDMDKIKNTWRAYNLYQKCLVDEHLKESCGGNKFSIKNIAISRAMKVYNGSSEEFVKLINTLQSYYKKRLNY